MRKVPEWMRQPGRAAPHPAGPGLPPVVGAQRLRSAPLRIEVVAVAVGGDRSAREALVMIETLRHFHPGVPVYVLAGAMAAEVLRAEPWGDDACILDEIDADELDALLEASQEAAQPHGDLWPLHWIAAKLEVLRRAIAAFPGRGVLLADADLIFTRRLPDLSWDADLVLSEHHGPLPDRLPPRSGIYNAGMVLCRDESVVDRWRELFATGVGGFYEQGCLEQLAREFVTDTFPGSWNWGNWRRTEDLAASGRVPAILHQHLERTREIPHRAESTRGIDGVAQRALTDIRTARQAPDKIAILHHAKAAGSSLAAMLSEAADRGGWQMLDSFAWPAELGRDWLEPEIDGIERGSMFGMRGARHIVHNHACNWSPDRVERWIQQGWVFVSVYRPIRERLCSFFFWNQRARVLPGPIGECETLDEFLRLFLEDPRYLVDWAPHPCDALVEHWGTPATLPELVERVTGLEVAQREENASSNPGWEALCASGEIQKSTKALIAKHPQVKVWEKFAKGHRYDL
jgi:hypothetical protein